MPERLLITGGAGFIGANFVHYWLKNHAQDSIVVLDALTYAGNRLNLKDVEIKKASCSYMATSVMKDWSPVYYGNMTLISSCILPPNPTWIVPLTARMHL